MKIIPYSEHHYDGCMLVFHSNVPSYFHENETKTYSDFLREVSNNYFVGLLENKVVACGGIVFKGQSSGFSWGMVSQDLHKTGLGKALLSYRLNKIKEQNPSSIVQLETSQHSYGFFEKFGFVVTEVKEEGIEKGLDLYKMQLDLSLQTS